jgi:hypothetical protein
VGHLTTVALVLGALKLALLALSALRFVWVHFLRPGKNVKKVWPARAIAHIGAPPRRH